jgi:acetyl-CoA carboxylase biotin carboxyl carrier protein
MTLEEIKHLIEFIREQDLTEFELEQDGVKIRIKSGGTPASLPLVSAVPVVAAATAAPPVPVAPPPAAASHAAALAKPEFAEEDGPALAIVKSPIVGTSIVRLSLVPSPLSMPATPSRRVRCSASSKR